MTQTNSESQSLPGKIIKVKKSDLPLCCPRNKADIPVMHPQVFIPLKKPGDIASCRYCRTRYQLEG